MCTHTRTHTHIYIRVHVKTHVHTSIHATKQRKNTHPSKLHIHTRRYTHTQSRLSVLGWTKIKLLAKRNRVYKYPAGSNDDSFYSWFIDPFLFPPFLFFFWRYFLVKAIINSITCRVWWRVISKMLKFHRSFLPKSCTGKFTSRSLFFIHRLPISTWHEKRLRRKDAKQWSISNRVTFLARLNSRLNPRIRNQPGEITYRYIWSNHSATGLIIGNECRKSGWSNYQDFIKAGGIWTTGKVYGGRSSVNSSEANYQVIVR